MDEKILTVDVTQAPLPSPPKIPANIVTYIIIAVVVIGVLAVVFRR